MKVRRPRYKAVQSVPEELLATGFRWEGIRQAYFTKIGDEGGAYEAHLLRVLYSKRIWDELRVSVDP